MSSPKEIVGYVELALNLRDYFAAMKASLGQLAKEVDDVKIQTLLIKEQFSTLSNQVRSVDTTERVQELQRQGDVLRSEVSNLRAQTDRNRSLEQLATLDKQMAVMYNEISHLRDRITILESIKSDRAVDLSVPAAHRLTDQGRKEASSQD